MKTTERLLSLDAFRGFTMASMVLVNNPGSWDHIYPQLEHAAWNGWTFTDCIFPFFLWSVGMSIPYSLTARMDRGERTSRIVFRVIRRTAVIFLLGLFLNGFPFGLLWDTQFSPSTMRIPGVLQRIAIGYCCASCAFLFFRTRGIIASVLILLISYWIMMKLIPVPGIELGSMEMGRNFASYIDSLFLQGHMWRGTVTWDPEGTISTLPAIASALGGVLASQYLRSGMHSAVEEVNWMFITGSFLLLLGTVLDMWLPINKGLWTSSYAVFMAGWSLVIFSIFYFFIDVHDRKRWAFFFIVFGSNAITAYILSTVQEVFVYGITVPMTESAANSAALSWKEYWMVSLFDRYFAPMTASLMYGLTTVGALYVILYLLWKKHWFLKV